MFSELLRIPRYDYEEIYRASSQRRAAKRRLRRLHEAREHSRAERSH